MLQKQSKLVSFWNDRRLSLRNGTINVMTVHFVCRGNVLRSFIAETYLKSLNLYNVTVLSSGTVCDQERPNTIGFFRNTLQLLQKHGIRKYAKLRPEQLTQQRIDAGDVTVFMNSVAHDEAAKIVKLPRDTFVWDITDIGEGDRIANDKTQRKAYEEVIYQELTNKIDSLVEKGQLIIKSV